MIARDAPELFVARSGAHHRSRRHRAAGSGKLWRRGRADAARVPAVWSSCLHAFLSRTKARVYARHCAALDRIERTRLTPSRSNVR